MRNAIDKSLAERDANIDKFCTHLDKDIAELSKEVKEVKQEAQVRKQNKQKIHLGRIGPVVARLTEDREVPGLYPTLA